MMRKWDEERKCGDKSKAKQNESGKEKKQEAAKWDCWIQKKTDFQTVVRAINQEIRVAMRDVEDGEDEDNAISAQ